MSEPSPLRPIDTETARARLAAHDNIIRAGGIKQGRELERKEQAAERARLEGQHAGQLEGVTKAHEAELKRYQKLVGKASSRIGLLWGIAIGWLSVSAFGFVFWLVTRETVLLNTATQRVNQSLEAGPVPSLEQWQQQQERRQEPGAAP